MKRCIITPTFSEHFQYNRDFLKTFDENVEDKQDIDINFIVGKNEQEYFSDYIKDFSQKLNINVFAFEDILQNYGINETSEELLNKFNKFSFQTFKKMYALRHLDYDQALIFDSETYIVKKINFSKLFDDYFQNPYFLFSDISIKKKLWNEERMKIARTVYENTEKILETSLDNKYLLEYFGWFYDKKIINDFFNSFNDEIPNILSKKDFSAEPLNLRHLFECFLYQGFIYKNNNKYNYKFYNTAEILEAHLGKKLYKEYLNTFLKSVFNSAGLFEHTSVFVNEKNLEALKEIHRKYNLTIFRCENYNDNSDLQFDLIDSTPISIVTASQSYKFLKSRIALCISGQPRQAKQNIAFLKDFIQGLNVDIFCHFNDGDKHKEFIINELQPKSYLFEKSRDFSKEVEEININEKFIKPERDKGSYSMFYSLYKANQLKKEYEQENNFKYDIVVRLRLDILAFTTLKQILRHISFIGDLNNKVYIPNHHHSVGINDQIAVGNSEIIDIYSDIYLWLEKARLNEYFNPEYLLYRYLKEKEINIKQFIIAYVLLRSDKVDKNYLPYRIPQQLHTWWSSKSQEKDNKYLDEYLSSKTESVFNIQDMNLETPNHQYFIKHSKIGKFISVDEKEKKIVLTEDKETKFFLLIGNNDLRTCINIKHENLNLKNKYNTLGWNLGIDNKGKLFPDCDAIKESLFFILRKDHKFYFQSINKNNLNNNPYDTFIGINENNELLANYAMGEISEFQLESVEFNDNLPYKIGSRGVRSKRKNLKLPVFYTFSGFLNYLKENQLSLYIKYLQIRYKNNKKEFNALIQKLFL